MSAPRRSEPFGPSPFRPNQLRYFVTVAEEGQITKAAQKLHLAQPALSQAITNLESQVGFALLERHARGVTITTAGAAFLEKALVMVATEDEVERTAESLSRAVHGTIAFGYLGLPPWQTTPDLVEAFAAAYPDVRSVLKELPFPSVPASSWLAEVDVTLAHPLTSDPHVWVQPVRQEGRAVLVSSAHPFAGRSDVTVAEVLDEPFIALDPSLDPLWRGFLTLDNERGGPPRQVAANPSANAQERFAMIAAGLGITVSSLANAEIIQDALRGVVAVPLSDAEPVPLSLVGREDRLNPLVEGLRVLARKLTEEDESEPAATA